VNEWVSFLSVNALWLIIVVPLMGAFLAGAASKLNKKWCFPIALFSVLFSFIFVMLLAQQVWAGGIVANTVEHVSQTTLTLPSGSVLPIRIFLLADGMSILMAFIGSLISVLAVIYSFQFIKSQETFYYPLFLVMISGMYGMVLTGDLFNLFVFLEISSISATGLVMTFNRKRSPDSAFKLITVSTIAAMMILVAIGILYSQYNALNMSFLAQAIQWTLLDKIALCLLFTGFAMKAGSVPMHFWVPDAYGDTPASVSAFFVVLSQASLYALFRICFSLFGLSINNVTVGWIIIILGVLSMFIGVMMALVQKDIKRLMAFHAISQTGYMLLGVGVGLAVLGTPAFVEFGSMAMQGSIFHMLNHSIYKGLLFLTAGAVFYAAGTRDLRELRGLGHYMPLTTIFFMVGAFAITGLPPFNGFASKLLIYESVYAFNPVLSAIALLVSILTLASFMKVFYAAFLGPKPKKKPKPIPHTMLFAMLVLSLLCVVFGLFPGIILDALIKPAVEALVSAVSYSGVFTFV